MYKTCQESAKRIDPSTVENRKKEQLLKIITNPKTGNNNKPKNIYNADEIGLFFWLPPNKTMGF